MTILGNILLGIAAFLYLVPLQLFLREPINNSGHAAGGVIAFVFVTIPLWLTIFAVWCSLLPRGGFDWLGGGRGWQLLVLIVTWLALTVVTSLGAMLREDPQIPWALRPLMPWGIYVLPLLALFGTSFLLNPSINASISGLAPRIALVVCGFFALSSSLGMILQWIIISEKQEATKVQREVAYQDENVRRIVAEVEALDPIKDLGRLLGHSAASRFEAPRDLAVKKIQTHPNLQGELAIKLTDEWQLEALGYLELNDPPDAAALAIPVRTALEKIALWIKGEIESSPTHWPEAYYSETKAALAVADKFAPYGVDYVPAIRAWRAAFDHPHAKQANIAAPQLVDVWLAKHAAAGKTQTTSSRR